MKLYFRTRGILHDIEGSNIEHCLHAALFYTQKEYNPHEYVELVDKNDKHLGGGVPSALLNKIKKTPHKTLLKINESIKVAEHDPFVNTVGSDS